MNGLSPCLVQVARPTHYTFKGMITMKKLTLIATAIALFAGAAQAQDVAKIGDLQEPTVFAKIADL